MFDFGEEKDNQQASLNARCKNLKRDVDLCIMKGRYAGQGGGLEAKKSEDLKKRLNDYANEVFKNFDRDTSKKSYINSSGLLEQ